MVWLLVSISLGETPPPARGESVGEPVGTPVGTPVGSTVGEGVGLPVEMTPVIGERLTPEQVVEEPLDLEQAARHAIEALCHARDATHMAQLVAPFMVRHSNGVTLESPPSSADLARLYGAFADIQVNVHTVLVEADRVALQSTWSVRTDVAAEPASFSVALTGRFENGQLVETWETWDRSVVETILETPAPPSRRAILPRRRSTRP